MVLLILNARYISGDVIGRGNVCDMDGYAMSEFTPWSWRALICGQGLMSDEDMHG
jgi:hypothetical protein